MNLKYSQDESRMSIVNAAQTILRDLAGVQDASGGASPLVHQSLSDVPLAVYSLGFEQLFQAGILKDAVPISWRVFVLNHHDEPVGAAEVTAGGGLNPPRFQSYNEGPQVAASGIALSRAESADDAGMYEPRFVEIPGIYTSALWLKNLGAGDDQIIPIKPIPGFLSKKAVYSPDEFLDLARIQARQRMEFDDEPEKAR